MALVFDKCCGCIDLRTGSFIIGYLNLIGNLILIALDAVIIVLSHEESNILTRNEKFVAFIVFIVACVMMFLLILFLTFAIVLVVGLHKEKRGHVKAYLIYATILIVILIIQFVASFALLPITVWNIITDVFSIILQTYFLLCLRSHYYRMGELSSRPTVYNIS